MLPNIFSHIIKFYVLEFTFLLNSIWPWLCLLSSNFIWTSYFGCGSTNKPSEPKNSLFCRIFFCREFFFHSKKVAEIYLSFLWSGSFSGSRRWYPNSTQNVDGIVHTCQQRRGPRTTVFSVAWFQFIRLICAKLQPNQRPILLIKFTFDIELLYILLIFIMEFFNCRPVSRRQKNCIKKWINRMNIFSHSVPQFYHLYNVCVVECLGLMPRWMVNKVCKITHSYAALHSEQIPIFTSILRSIRCLTFENAYKFNDETIFFLHSTNALIY